VFTVVPAPCTDWGLMRLLGEAPQAPTPVLGVDGQNQQGMSTCFADLRKRPETVCGLPFWLITGSRCFAACTRPAEGPYLKITPEIPCVPEGGDLNARAPVQRGHFPIVPWGCGTSLKSAHDS
jgi:hypothetical protein